MRTPTLGKILGGVGLLLLLSSPFTYFLTTGSAGFAIGKALVGLLFVGAFFATNYKNLGQFASGRASFFMVSSVVLCAVVLGALGAVNYIVAKRNKTWDFTSKKLHSLAPQTVQTLKGLKEKVTAIAFVAPTNLDIGFFRDIFERYRNEAPDKFDFSFKDPAKHPDLARKYNLREGQNTIVLVRGEGANETSQTLGAMSEQDLTNALIKLDKVGEQKAYFLVGHGEYPLQPTGGEQDAFRTSLTELTQSLRQESVSTEALNLLEKPEVPKDAAMLVVAGPKAPLTEPELKKVEKYLDEGGRLVFLPDIQADSGLDPLLAKYGLEVDEGQVADQIADRTPYNPVSLFYANHEVTRLLQEAQLAVRFSSVRGITVLRQGTLEGVKAEPLVLSSPYAWQETTPDGEPEPSEGEKTGQMPLAALSSRNTANAANKRSDEARLLVVGDAELVTNGEWGRGPNQNFLLNGMAWVRNQAELITLRPPDREESSLDIDDALLAKLRFVTTDLFPVTLLALGLGIWLSRRDK